MDEKRKPAPVVSRTKAEVKRTEAVKAGKQRLKEVTVKDRRLRAQRIGKVIAGGGYLRLVIEDDPRDALLEHPELLTKVGRAIARRAYDRPTLALQAKLKDEQVKARGLTALNRKFGILGLGISTVGDLRKFVATATEEQLVDFIVRELSVGRRFFMVEYAFTRLTRLRYWRELALIRDGCRPSKGGYGE